MIPSPARSLRRTLSIAALAVVAVAGLASAGTASPPPAGAAAPAPQVTAGRPAPPGVAAAVAGTGGGCTPLYSVSACISPDASPGCFNADFYTNALDPPPGIRRFIFIVEGEYRYYIPKIGVLDHAYTHYGPWKICFDYVDYARSSVVVADPSGSIIYYTAFSPWANN